MNREPGFSSDFAASNAGTLMWLVFGALIIAILSTLSGYARNFLEIIQ